MGDLQSDLTLPAAKFNRATIDLETQAFNEKLIKIWADGPRWYEVRTFPLFSTSLPPPGPFGRHLFTSSTKFEFTQCLRIIVGRRSRIPQTPLGRQNTTTETYSFGPWKK